VSTVILFMSLCSNNMWGIVSRVGCDNVKGGNPGWSQETPCSPLSAPAPQSPSLSEVWAPPSVLQMVHLCGSSKTWLLYLVAGQELSQDWGLCFGSPACGPHMECWCPPHKAIASIVYPKHPKHCWSWLQVNVYTTRWHMTLNSTLLLLHTKQHDMSCLQSWTRFLLVTTLLLSLLPGPQAR
jgi:hypothetical protein